MVAISRFSAVKNVPVNAAKITLFKRHQKTLQVHIHNATVTENVQSVHPQLQHKPPVAVEILSQPCQLVPEAGCPSQVDCNIFSSKIVFGFGWRL